MSDFGEVIAASPIVLGLEADTPEGVIEALVDAMVAAGRLPAGLRDAAVASACERERSASTAISNGIAIPHGYIDGVDGVVAAIGVSRTGVDFGALDGQLSRVFVLMFNSPGASVDHIRFLVALNRRLLQPAVCDRLFMAATREEVVAIVSPAAGGVPAR